MVCFNLGSIWGDWPGLKSEQPRTTLMLPRTYMLLRGRLLCAALLCTVLLTLLASLSLAESARVQRPLQPKPSGSDRALTSDDSATDDSTTAPDSVGNPSDASPQFDCFAAPAVPGDRRRHKGQLRVAQLNAEWLMLNASSCPGLPGQSAPVRCTKWANFTAAMEHLHKVAVILSEIDADIVNLCEVQDCVVLRQLLLDPALANSSYMYVLFRCS